MRAPISFRIAAIALLLWGAMGCYACYGQFRYGAESWGPGITDRDRAFYAALPVWYDAVYAVAVGCGFLAALALLARSTLAIPLFASSIAGVVAMFGYTFVATDLIARKGVAVATGFPLLILAVAVAGLALSRHARRRRWIG